MDERYGEVTCDVAEFAIKVLKSSSLVSSTHCDTEVSRALNIQVKPDSSTQECLKPLLVSRSGETPPCGEA